MYKPGPHPKSNTLLMAEGLNESINDTDSLIKDKLLLPPPQSSFKCVSKTKSENFGSVHMLFVLSNFFFSLMQKTIFSWFTIPF